MNAQEKVIAIFDFDGTIIAKDSFLEFIRFTHGYAALYCCLLFHSIHILLFMAGLYPNYKLKEKFFTFFYKGEREDKLNKIGKEFAGTISQYVYKEAGEILAWHKQKSHEILILTASSPIWLQEWCKQNEYKLIGTNFETKNEVYTGKIKGKNCWGGEKLKYIDELIKKHNYHKIFAYGNSRADTHYMRKAHYFHYGALDFKGKLMINDELLWLSSIKHT